MKFSFGFVFFRTILLLAFFSCFLFYPFCMGLFLFFFLFQILPFLWWLHLIQVVIFILSLIFFLVLFTVFFFFFCRCIYIKAIADHPIFQVFQVRIIFESWWFCINKKITAFEVIQKEFVIRSYTILCALAKCDTLQLFHPISCSKINCLCNVFAWIKPAMIWATEHNHKLIGPLVGFGHF